MTSVIPFPDTRERMARRIKAAIPCDVLAEALCIHMGIPMFGSDIAFQLSKPREQPNVQVIETWIPTCLGSAPRQGDDPLDLIPILETMLRKALRAAYECPGSNR